MIELLFLFAVGVGAYVINGDTDETEGTDPDQTGMTSSSILIVIYPTPFPRQAFSLSTLAQWVSADMIRL